MDTLQMFIGTINAINFTYQVRENVVSKELKESLKKALQVKLRYCNYSKVFEKSIFMISKNFLEIFEIITDLIFKSFVD